MAYFEKEELRQAKQMTAIEFLKRYRPDELVRCGTGEYELRSHDSFKISESTSLWHWKSRDIGGKSALDYLIHVEGVPFLDAVRYLLEQEPPGYAPQAKTTEQKPFVLPAGARETHRIELYLQSRGISLAVIRYCISKGILYESLPHHNCVFVGLNNEGVLPRKIRTPEMAAARCFCKDGPCELQRMDNTGGRQFEHIPRRHREAVIGAHRARTKSIHLHHDRLRHADGIGKSYGFSHHAPSLKFTLLSILQAVGIPPFSRMHKAHAGNPVHGPW